MALECHVLSPRWARPLAAFFRALRDAGDDREFHPHALTDEEAARRCAYAGADLYCVLTDGERVVAYGMLRGWDEGYVVPSLGIAVHPGERGRGLGRLLMHFLHAAAVRKGATRIRLKVYPRNTAAVRMYESLGYRVQGQEAGQLVAFLELVDS